MMSNITYLGLDGTLLIADAMYPFTGVSARQHDNSQLIGVKHRLRPRPDSLCTGSTLLVGPPGDAGFTGDLAAGLLWGVSE
jgi:hypothetical protein